MVESKSDLTENFIFMGNFGQLMNFDKSGILYLPYIFTPLTLYLRLLFNKSILLPVNMCKIDV